MVEGRSVKAQQGAQRVLVDLIVIFKRFIARHERLLDKSTVFSSED